MTTTYRRKGRTRKAKPTEALTRTDSSSTRSTTHGHGGAIATSSQVKDRCTANGETSPNVRAAIGLFILRARLRDGAIQLRSAGPCSVRHAESYSPWAACCAPDAIAIQPSAEPATS